MSVIERLQFTHEKGLTHLRTSYKAQYRTFIQNVSHTVFSFPTYSLSELPECQMPIAMKTDVIDQILAIACCSDYEIIVSVVSVNMIMCLAQSPGAHPYLIRTKVIEDLLKICALREKLNNKLPPEEKEDSAAFKVLK